MVTGATGRSSALAGLATIGGRVEAEYAEVVQAYVPVGALRKLADLAAVSYVGVPAVPLADSTTDEVVVASNAGTWQAAGISGAGVKVGIIDLGFIGYTVAQTNGDLPPSVTTADFGCGGVATGTSHGTAVAEIVYKMAPSAQLYLICIATNINLGQAKDYALAQGITIVNHSVGWFNTSRGDGTGGPSSPDAIVSSARAGGILWINAAGNAAQYHWSGTFVDANANGYHDFAPGSELDTFVVGSGATVCAWLKWDSWPTTAQDFDLYLFQLSPLTRVKSSTNAQTGTQPPTEQLCYANSGPTQSFGLAIWRFSATATPTVVSSRTSPGKTARRRRSTESAVAQVPAEPGAAASLVRQHHLRMSRGRLPLLRRQTRLSPRHRSSHSWRHAHLILVRPERTTCTARANYGLALPRL
jgi:hypothetical protein